MSKNKKAGNGKKRFQQKELVFGTDVTKASKSKNTTLVIQTTTEYDIFSPIEGNRRVANSHRDKLIESMQKLGQIDPIVVNENYEVVDGSHRLSACRELGIAVMYIISKGATLEHVKMMNTLNKGWKFENYLHMYRQDAYPDSKSHYDKVFDFRQKYDLSDNITLLLLSGGLKDAKSHSFFALRQQFNDGKFKVTSTEKAEKTATNLEEVIRINKEVKQQHYAVAVLKLSTLPKSPKSAAFSWEILKEKMEKYGYRLPHCSKVEDFCKYIINRIYNYRLAKKDRIRYTIDVE